MSLERPGGIGSLGRGMSLDCAHWRRVSQAWNVTAALDRHTGKVDSTRFISVACWANRKESKPCGSSCHMPKSFGEDLQTNGIWFLLCYLCNRQIYCSQNSECPSSESGIPQTTEWLSTAEWARSSAEAGNQDKFLYRNQTPRRIMGKKQASITCISSTLLRINC